MRIIVLGGVGALRPFGDEGWKTLWWASACQRPRPQNFLSDQHIHTLFTAGSCISLGQLFYSVLFLTHVNCPYSVINTFEKTNFVRGRPENT